MKTVRAAAALAHTKEDYFAYTAGWKFQILK
jgi:hypothetical protein